MSLENSPLAVDDEKDDDLCLNHQSELRAEMLFHKMLDAFAYHEIICNDEGVPVDYRFLEVNPAFERLTGLGREQVVGRTARELMNKQTPGWLARFAHVALTGEPIQFEEYSVALDRYLEVSVYSPRPGCFAMTFDDVTSRKVAEREVERLAYYNPLSLLPNRQLVSSRLSEKLQKVDAGSGIWVFCIDLDRFRTINDSLGYSSGDTLIKGAAVRLMQVVGKGQLLGHICGDEFAIVLEGLRDEEDAARYAATIMAVLAEPFTLRGRGIYLTASIGVASSEDGEVDAEGLLRRANMAMYHAKDAGRNCWRLYTSAIHELSEERLAMEQSLHCAIEREEFSLHYQPVINARTGAVESFEALLRWTHPHLGMVPPDRVIPVAEETGLIIPIGEWVLRTACIQLMRLHREGYPHLRMAVNVSGRQLRHARFVESFARIFAETGIDPCFLELELTETSIMEDSERTVTALHALQQMGVSLAIDDFGTGYSSLSYLKRFSINRLKIDRSFVRDLPHNSDDAAIVKAIVAMARALRLSVTGEGVETEDQLKLLGECGCDNLQGFYIARPAPVEALYKILSGDAASIAAFPQQFSSL